MLYRWERGAARLSVVEVALGISRLRRRWEMKAVLKGGAAGTAWGMPNSDMGRGRWLRQFCLMAPHCIYASHFPSCAS